MLFPAGPPYKLRSGSEDAHENQRSQSAKLLLWRGCTRRQVACRRFSVTQFRVYGAFGPSSTSARDRAFVFGRSPPYISDLRLLLEKVGSTIKMSMSAQNLLIDLNLTLSLKREDLGCLKI
jgi:hypothetical protein